MKLTSVGRDTLHKLDQPLKELAYVSNHWGPLLLFDQMAATIIGGLTVASVLSLFVMPAFYYLFFKKDEEQASDHSSIKQLDLLNATTETEGEQNA